MREKCISNQKKIASVNEFNSLENERRSHVETACAAFHLNRKPQTLRAWACLENGPIRPHRLNGRLIWAVADIKLLLNAEQSGCFSVH
jgi:hypothetical protein